MTIASFDFTFPGLVRDGRCYLTIETTPQSAWVVCSQRRNYSGTSVTNAVEKIAAKLHRDLAEGNLDSSSGSQQKVAAALKALWKINGREKRALRKWYVDSPVQWIEHYPAEPSFGEKDIFREVTFDEDDAPSWLPTYNVDAARAKFGGPLVDEVLRVTGSSGGKS